jgi:hypothetical protein
VARKNRKTLKAPVLSRGTFGFSVPALCLVVMFASCASVPRTFTEAEASGDAFAFLDPGGLAYLAVDVPQARPFLDLVSLGGMTGNMAERALDMTDTAAAAFYSPEDERGFLLAARGRYPSSRLRFSLGISPAWKKTRSEGGGRYWRSGGDNLSVYVDPRYALISAGDPFPRTGGVTAPEPFGEFRPGAALAGWVPDAEARINQFLSGMRIPLWIPADLLVFGVYPAQAEQPTGETDAAASRFFVKLRLELPSPSHAEALVSMIALIRAYIVTTDISGEGGFSLVPFLFANAPIRDDASLILTTAVMDAGEIALLFNMFSLYFK